MAKLDATERKPTVILTVREYDGKLADCFVLLVGMSLGQSAGAR
jgi:hypothetical protein